MAHTVPFEVFDDFEQPIFVTDENESVEYANRAASRFFGVDPQSMKRACHEVFGLCAPDGQPLCYQGGCLVQRLARAGRLPQTFPAVFARPGTAPVRLNVRAFALAPPRLGRAAILHMLTVADQAVAESDSSLPIPKQTAGMVARLSAREVEVLRELAKGRTTEEVARTLFVSPATVRNHIRHVLDKLGVHRRLDAVLAWVRLRKRGRAGRRPA